MLAITPSGEASRLGPAREKGPRSRHRHQHRVHTVPALSPRPREVDQPVPRPDSIVGLQPPRSRVLPASGPNPTRGLGPCIAIGAPQLGKDGSAQPEADRAEFPHRPLEGAMPSRKKTWACFSQNMRRGQGIMTETSISQIKHND